MEPQKRMESQINHPEMNESSNSPPCWDGTPERNHKEFILGWMQTATALLFAWKLGGKENHEEFISRWMKVRLYCSAGSDGTSRKDKIAEKFIPASAQGGNYPPLIQIQLSQLQAVGSREKKKKN
jgi:hypothetical protein